MMLFSKLIVCIWLCCNSLACIKPLQPQNDSSSVQSSSHQRLGFRFERIPEGVLVVHIAENMGAGISGLQTGDIIFTANGAAGEALISVLQDRSQDYVHLEIQPRWSKERKILVVQRGVGSAVESPTVDPLLKFAAVGDVTGAKALFQDGVYQSEDVVTSLRLISRNYPQQYGMWLDLIRTLVPINIPILEALMRGYNAQREFARTIEVYDAWKDNIGWDLWTSSGAVYTHTNLGVEQELVRALMKLESQATAQDRLKELQRWHVDVGLEAIVDMPLPDDVNVVWSDKRPTFADASGVDVQGNTWSVDDKPWTVLAFWATWCAPCKKEIPELNEWVLSRSDVNVLAVNVDDNLDSAGVAKALKKLGSTSLRGVQSADLLRRVGVDAIPTLVLLDSTGTERYRMIGYSPDTVSEMEFNMTTVTPRVKLANARNVHVEWYPKPTLSDVLYDGQQLWLLDDQKIKHVQTLTGWLQGTDAETLIDTPRVSENGSAERLIQIGSDVGTIHSSGRIVRFPIASTLGTLSFGESILDWYISDTQVWVWGDTALESVSLERELQHTSLRQDPLPSLPMHHVDAFPLYKDDMLTQVTDTELLSSRQDVIRWNSSALSPTTLLGHDLMALMNVGSIQWLLRRHSGTSNNWTYSLVALDEQNTPLATLSTVNLGQPKPVLGYPSKEGDSDVEDGKSLWLVIPNQGLLYIEIADLQSQKPNRRE